MQRVFASALAAAIAAAVCASAQAETPKWTPCGARLDPLVPVAPNVYGAVIAPLRPDVRAVRLFVNTDISSPTSAYAVGA